MKNIKSSVLLILVTCGLLFFACNEATVKENLEIAKGVDYYPIEVGKFISYQLDSIIYSGISGSECVFARDTFSTLLKEEVVDVFEDNTGDLNYIVERYTRPDENSVWAVKDVWNTKITNTKVERVEENLRFIKMVFPVREGATWNGNGFFQDTTTVLGGETIDFYEHWSDEYEFDSVDQPEEINGMMFDSVMTVIQSAPSTNKINHRVSIEKYARGVGLIYKEMLILDTQCKIGETACGGDGSGLEYCNGIPWEEKAQKGLILKQRVIDFN